MPTTLLDTNLHRKQNEIAGSTINPLTLCTANQLKVNTSVIPVDSYESIAIINSVFAEYIRENIRIGTGGYVSVNMMTCTRTTGGALYSLKSPSISIKDNFDKNEPVYKVEDIVSTIRSSLSLNIQEMAKILKVERQTVYSWIGGSSEPHPSNRNRLNKIFLIAKCWEKLCYLPVGNAVRHSFDENGKSIVDLLSEDTLHEKEIFAHLEFLAKNQNRDKNLHNKQSKPSVRELAVRHNLKIRESSDTIDWLTGKRVDTE